jgi:acetyl esterase/lipase
MTFDLADRISLDSSLELAVSGLQPGSLVTLRARLLAPDGLRWTSSAQFAASAAGLVDVASDAPVAGSYAGTDANGLLWSLTPDLPSDAEQSALLSGVTPLRVEIGCAADGRELGAGTVTIERSAPGTQVRDVRGHGLNGTLYIPAGNGQHRPVLVLGGSGGDANEPVAAFLAAHGFLALALRYFAASGLPDELVDIELEYFGRALAWLAAQPEAEPGSTAVVGRSRGGELALLLGLHLGVDTVVAFVPSGIVHSGIRKGGAGWLSDVPAWRLGGRPLPYLPHAGQQLEWRDGAIVCTPTYLSSLEDWAAVLAATIPLEDCRAEVLLISGTADAVWPSALFGELAMSRLRRRPAGAVHRHLALAGAGHRFLPPVLPSTVSTVRHAQAGERLALGGTPEGNARGGRRAYTAMLAALGGAMQEIMETEEETSSDPA